MERCSTRKDEKATADPWSATANSGVVGKRLEISSCPKVQWGNGVRLFQVDTYLVKSGVRLRGFLIAWRRLTRAIQCPACGLLQDPSAICFGCKTDTSDVKSPFRGFRFHDLRHQAKTELAESKASDQTIMGIAGHVSKKMLQHYSHIRMEAKRNALDALSMESGSNRGFR